jgi:hypothetical protein
MALPDKIYPDYDRSHTGEEGFKFITRDPAAEMEYTAKTLAEVMKVGGYWAQAETAAGTVLKDRFNSVLSSVGVAARAEYDALVAKVKTEVYGSATPTSDVVYTQFLAGMSAAMGGGHTSVSMFANIAVQQRQLEVSNAAAQAAQSVLAHSFDSVKSMPLVVPIESQLISDAHASAVEASSAGQIRSQQIRQSKAAGNVLGQITPNVGTNPTPVDEVVMFGSLHAQGAAASTV